MIFQSLDAFNQWGMNWMNNAHAYKRLAEQAQTPSERYRLLQAFEAAMQQLSDEFQNHLILTEGAYSTPGYETFEAWWQEHQERRGRATWIPQTTGISSSES